MQFRVTRSNLLSCLESVKDACSSARVDPILDNVLISVQEHHLTILATDHVVQIVSSCDLIDDAPTFKFLFPCQEMHKMLSCLDAEAVVIFTVEGNKVTVKTGGPVFTFMVMDTDKLTPLEFAGQSEEEKWHSFPASDLLRVLKHVRYASAILSHRPSLNGVFVDRTEQGISFCATDGHRLATEALTGAPESQPSADSNHCTLPRRTVDILVKNLRDKGLVDMYMADSTVTFVYRDENDETGEKCTFFKLVSNTIDENYPDYRSVIPSMEGKRVILERAKLLEVMRRATSFADKQDTVRLLFSAGKLDINLSNKNSNSMRDSLTIAYDNDEMEIAFKIEFLADMLAALNDTMVILSLKEPTSSMLVTTEESTFRYVVMPVRL